MVALMGTHSTTTFEFTPPSPLHPPAGVVGQTPGSAAHQGPHCQTAASQCHSATDSSRSSHSGTAPTPRWHGRKPCSRECNKKVTQQQMMSVK